jgi:putative ABC transport system permease protein
MLAHYLLTLYRAMTRHWLYAALNVFGLALGVAVFLVLWLDVRFETGFERWIPEVDQIYQVRTDFVDDASAGTADGSAGGLLELLRGDYPQLLGTRMMSMGATLRLGGQVAPERVEAVDPSFFKVFDLPLLAGDRGNALASPDGVVLTEAKAEEYFGAADPMGRILSMSVGGEPQRPYRVTGVLATPPKNTDQYFDVLIVLPARLSTQTPAWTHLDFVTCRTFLKLRTPAEAQVLASDLDRFVDRHGVGYLASPGHDHLQLKLQPLRSMHLSNPKSAVTVAALGAVGILTAILAAVNYVNLATVSAAQRAREVAMRKVLGATAPALLVQFMGEALATAAVAGLFALCLCELALPFVNAAGGMTLKLDYWDAGGVLPLAALCVVLVGLGAGLYPALVLSRFQPAAVLASARSPSGGRAGGRVREALVVFQFAVAIAFAIGAAVVISQAEFVRRADLGFQRDGLITVGSFARSEVSDQQRSNLLTAWRGLPGVLAATGATMAPGRTSVSYSQIFHRRGARNTGPWISLVTTGPDFFKTYGVRFIAGRPLDLSHGADNFEIPTGENGGFMNADITFTPIGVDNVVLNANAVSSLGFRSARDAVGQTIDETSNGKFVRSYVVVGAVDNFRFGTPRSPVNGTLYRMMAQPFDDQIATIRYAGADPQVLMGQLQAAWRQIAPDAPFQAKPTQQDLQLYYDADEHQGRLFSLGAGLAVLIGCVGLFGLASFNTARRVREIGVRKTLGASTFDVLRLLIGQFLRPVILANLIAWPVAFLAMRGWLSNFDQKIVLGPGYFLSAAILTLLIAIGTVASQAFAAAQAEPAKALRHE